MDWLEAQKKLGKRRFKKLGNNTYLIVSRHDVSNQPIFGVKLHKTIVVEILPSGEFALNSGGFTTRTTKNRIETYSPAYIVSRKGTWHLRTPNHPKDIFKFVEFFDGVLIDENGSVLNGDPSAIKPREWWEG